MISIEIDPIVAAAAPRLKVLAIEATVENSPTRPELLEMIDEECRRLRESLEIPAINRRPAIAATRAAYKALGKEPNRYRPAGEALCRRIVKGQDLFVIDTLVDMINLLSIRSGYSIGGFDASLIEGTKLVLGRGNAGEPYEGIGRGTLNIEGMPVYRDAVGGIGTPTSDNERTKISLSTTRLLMIVNCYGEEMPLEQFKDEAVDLLRRFASASEIHSAIIIPK